ncbi:hypothetical protein ACHAXS_004994 [Conticribra weissflogii]
MAAGDQVFEWSSSKLQEKMAGLVDWLANYDPPWAAN